MSEGENASRDHLEREKLALEIKALKRSPFATPGTWISIVLAITTVGGLVGSNMISEHKIALAELDAKEKTIAADERVAAAAASVATAETAVALAERQTLELRHEALSLARQKDAYTQQVAAAQENLADLQVTADELRQLGVASALVDTLDAQITSTNSLFNFCSAKDVEIYDAALSLEPNESTTARHFNLPWGAPSGDVTDDEIPVEQIWWIGGYDPSLKVARWTAHRLDKDRLSPDRQRQDCWRADPRFPDGMTATADDLRGLEFDRGHLVPRADMTVSDLAQASTYVYTNLTAQNPSLNRHVWSQLEQRVRSWTEAASGPVYVATGTVFDHNNDGRPDDEAEIPRVGANQVAIPSHYYKIVLRLSAAGTPQLIAFLMPNDDSSLPLRDDLATAVVSVDALETLTGLDFFPQFTESLSANEAIVDIEAWLH